MDAPLQMDDETPVLDRLADLLGSVRDTEDMVRPLLELLEAITGMESTYFTRIDLAANIQRVVYSRNSMQLQIPEGIQVEWDDTLCKRALDEGRPFTDDVPAQWGDSDAARQLGIQSYLSAPVRVADGELRGTLCAASGSRARMTPRKQRLIDMFAQLIARQLESEQLLAHLRRENIELSEYALTDLLTGIPNRRALLLELDRMLARAKRESSCVHVAFVDLDGFKAINDTYGHDAGDRFLVQIASRLSAQMRRSDLCGRYGGDEFIVATMAPPVDDPKARDALAARIESALSGWFEVGTGTLDYAGPSVGVVTASDGETDVDALLARADAAMYAVKTDRKQARS